MILTLSFDFNSLTIAKHSIKAQMGLAPFSSYINNTL